MPRPRRIPSDALATVTRWARTLVGLPSVKAFAADLGVSERTVQRALREAYMRERDLARSVKTNVMSDSDVSRGTHGGSVPPHASQTRPQSLDGDPSEDPVLAADQPAAGRGAG